MPTQGVGSGEGAIVDEGLMVIFNDDLLQLIPLDFPTVDFGADIFALAKQ